MSLLRKIKSILLENASQNDNTLFGSIKTLKDSGRYHIIHDSVESNPGYHDSHNFFAIANKPRGAENFLTRNGDDRKSSVGWYDKSISHIKNDHPEEKYSRNHIELNSDSGLHHNIQDSIKNGVIYRGMSHEEFHGIEKNGHIKSNGSANMGGQENLTYYSKDPAQAEFYAHGFAPAQHKATGSHHAYVVAVKDPGTDVRIPGVGENEVGIPHPVNKSEILHVHKAIAYHATPGQYETRVSKYENGVKEGSSSAPHIGIGWKKMSYDEAKK